jgi:hypothetical protein
VLHSLAHKSQSLLNVGMSHHSIAWEWQPKPCQCVIGPSTNCYSFARERHKVLASIIIH